MPKGNPSKAIALAHRFASVSSVRCLEPFKEKPHAPVRRAGRVKKFTGVALSQEAKSKKGPSLSDARHGDDNAHGTAQEGTLWMDERPSAIPTQLRLPLE